jgi:hypothetical protein
MCRRIVPIVMSVAIELDQPLVTDPEVERRSNTDELVGSRAGGMTSRMLEILDSRGIAG